MPRGVWINEVHFQPIHKIATQFQYNENQNVVESQAEKNKFFAPYLFGENATIPLRCVCSCYAWWIFREIFWRQFQLSSPAFEMTNFTISIISGFCLHSFNTQRRRRNYLGQYWYTSIHSSKFLLLKKSCLLEEGRYWSSQLDWRLTEHCRYSTHSEK